VSLLPPPGRHRGWPPSTGAERGVRAPPPPAVAAVAQEGKLPSLPAVVKKGLEKARAFLSFFWTPGSRFLSHWQQKE